MTEKELFTQLAGLNWRLTQIVEERGSLHDPRVVEVSQEMDVIVARIQRMRMLKKIS